ncbi:MAG: hypothetical protein JW811_03995 [Clostridiales bacterium]|nr:hypothetical protein [Clostridiales bacterium]
MAVDCPCTSTCERHGDCAACVANHFNKGNLPFCLRDIGKKQKKERKQEKKLEKQQKKRCW